MDWFSPENIVAVVAALVALVPPAVGAWNRRRSPRRKRIGYRVQLDTAIGGSDGPGGRLGLFTELPVSDASLVLLRIENDGADSIAESDYTNPDRDHGLNVVFDRRTVRSVEVIPQPDAEHLRSHFVPVEGKDGEAGKKGLRHHGNTIHLPRVPLNQDQHFKLLVLLTGGGVGRKVDVSGGIRDGEVKRTRSMTVDDTPPLFSRPALGITALLTLCVLVLAVIIVVRHPPPSNVVRLRPPPVGCATGQLRVIGSTAFAPVLNDLARQYEADCPNSAITVDARGSNDGVQALRDTASPAVVALSDGPRPDSFTELRENSVAVSAFALVVNDQVDVKDLTVDQIRRIYGGDVLNWAELGGPDLPILLVSRDSNSGTRDVFRRHVLDGEGEPAFTSRDCLTRNSPQDRVIRCERASTEQVLTTVARLPGAIGYSELRAATGSSGLHTLSINGRAPSVEAIGADTYPFAEIEYAYTSGAPPTGSLAASFLNYMIRGNGQDVIRAHGHLPCFTPEGLGRCQK
ncbi:MAG: PstS family phosphate ABC transporter substrate-binding protein [Actinomadura sp.]